MFDINNLIRPNPMPYNAISEQVDRVNAWNADHQYEDHRAHVLVRYHHDLVTFDGHTISAAFLIGYRAVIWIDVWPSPVNLEHVTEIPTDLMGEPIRRPFPVEQ